MKPQRLVIKLFNAILLLIFKGDGLASPEPVLGS